VLTFFLSILIAGDSNDIICCCIFETVYFFLRQLYLLSCLFLSLNLSVKSD
jgi:hypothetical protein